MRKAKATLVELERIAVEQAAELTKHLVVALKNNSKNRTAREVADAYGAARRYLKKKEGRR